MSALTATPVGSARADEPGSGRLLRRVIVVAGAAGAAWFIGALSSTTSAHAAAPAHPAPAPANAVSRPDLVSQLVGDTLRTVLGKHAPAAAPGQQAAAAARPVRAAHPTHLSHPIEATRPADSSPQLDPAPNLSALVTGLVSQTSRTVQSVTHAVPVPVLAEVVDPLVRTVDAVSGTVLAPTLGALDVPPTPQVQYGSAGMPAGLMAVPARPVGLVSAALPVRHAVRLEPIRLSASRATAAAVPRGEPIAQSDLPAAAPLPTAPPRGPNPVLPTPDGTAAAAGSSTGTNLMATTPPFGGSPRYLVLGAVPLAARGIVRMDTNDPGFSPD
jgi:hypothetical protein